MWLDGIKRFASRLGRVRRKSRALTESAASREAPYDTEFDTTWHGDHWQNLLSSPLDARHYVMEDWTYTPPPQRSRGGRTRGQAQAALVRAIARGPTGQKKSATGKSRRQRFGDLFRQRKSLLRKAEIAV